MLRSEAGVRLLAVTVSLCVGAEAVAVPLQVATTGRALDAAGDPLEGTQELTFTLWDHPTTGTALWAETLEVSCVDGFFAAVLGLDAGRNPLDDALFDRAALYVGLAVGPGAELTGRQRIASLPYAVRAGTASAVDGGPVDAASVRVGGVTVLDGSGAFTGEVAGATLGDLACAAGQLPTFDGAGWGCAAPTGTVAWSDVTGIPPALLDGDGDTFAALGCLEGQTPYRAAGFASWGCVDAPTEQSVEDAVTKAPIALPAGSRVGGAVIATGPHTVDTRLTEAQVEGYVRNGPIALAGGSRVGGVAVSTGPHTVDTKLTRAEVRTFVTDDAIDLAPGSRMGGARLSVGPHTVDTRLTEAQVEAYVTNGPLVLDAQSTVGGGAIVTGIPVVADFRYAQTAEALALSVPIPWDDTVPQVTEGTELLTVTIAPKAVGNLLVFEGTVNWTEPVNSSDYVTLALFEGAGTSAIAATTDGSSNGNGRCTANDSYPQVCTMPFQFVRVAGSTASTTYRLRAGIHAGTMYVNQGFNGRKLGGTLYSTLSVTEVKQ